jgi:hypothetical protein
MNLAVRAPEGRKPWLNGRNRGLGASETLKADIAKSKQWIEIAFQKA